MATGVVIRPAYGNSGSPRPLLKRPALQATRCGWRRRQVMEERSRAAQTIRVVIFYRADLGCSTGYRDCVSKLHYSARCRSSSIAEMRTITSVSRYGLDKKALAHSACASWRIPEVSITSTPGRCCETQRARPIPSIGSGPGISTSLKTRSIVLPVRKMVTASAALLASITV